MKFCFFHLMPYADLDPEAVPKYGTSWVTLPNSYYDPRKGAGYYKRYLDELVLAAELGFDAVAVNPPYVDARSRTALAAEVRDHEPAPALFAERGGLAIFERLFGELAAAAPRFLACEVGAGQADDIVRLAERRGRWRLVARRRDFGGIERDLAWQRTA